MPALAPDNKVSNPSSEDVLIDQTCDRPANPAREERCRELLRGSFNGRVKEIVECERTKQNSAEPDFSCVSKQTLLPVLIRNDWEKNGAELQAQYQQEHGTKIGPQESIEQVRASLGKRESGVISQYADSLMLRHDPKIETEAAFKKFAEQLRAQGWEVDFYPREGKSSPAWIDIKTP